MAELGDGLLHETGRCIPIPSTQNFVYCFWRLVNDFISYAVCNRVSSSHIQWSLNVLQKKKKKSESIKFHLLLVTHTCSTLLALRPVVSERILTKTSFWALTSFHLICTSVACLSPVLGTLGWWSIAVACGVMNLFPFCPADKSMHAWPMATPVPTV